LLTVESYSVAVAMCVVTMLCWGSWANTQKLASKEWRFQLFYWDYAIGVFLLALLLAFTFGSSGGGGRGFVSDLTQAEAQGLGSAFLGGVIFNLANILLVAAIDIAGMAVAFPVGIGLALVLGVGTTYVANPEGNVPMLPLGVGCVMLAIVLDALAYQRLAAAGKKAPTKGIILSAVAGVLMGFFYSFVAHSMGKFDAAAQVLEAGKLSPYTDRHRALQCGGACVELPLEQHRHGQTFQRGACDLPRVFHEGQHPLAPHRDPGRHDLECRYEL
jgi:glucose uptake protein